MSTVAAPAVAPPVVEVRTRGQMFWDEVKSSFTIGFGQLAIMSAFSARWGLFGAGVGFAVGQILVGWLPKWFHGGHGNPDVTLAKAVRGSIFVGETVARWLGQILGWSIVVFAGVWWYWYKSWSTGFGVVKPEPGMPVWAQIIVPAILLFLFTTLAVLVTEHLGYERLSIRMRPKASPLQKAGFVMLGIVLGVFVYFGAAFGTGINGMREFVPSVATLFLWPHAPVQFYWWSLLGGRLGSLAAGLVGQVYYHPVTYQEPVTAPIV